MTAWTIRWLTHSCLASQVKARQPRHTRHQGDPRLAPRAAPASNGVGPRSTPRSFGLTGGGSTQSGCSAGVSPLLAWLVCNAVEDDSGQFRHNLYLPTEQ